MTSITSPLALPDKIAEAVSMIFHPLIIVIPTMVLAMIFTGSTFIQAILWTLLAVSIVNIPVAILVITGVRSGRYSDASVSIKEQRYRIYLIGGLCLVTLLLILIIGKAPKVLTACLVSAIAATIIGYLINLYTKISLHSVAVAGCTTVLLLTMPWIGYLLAICTPLVGWARIRLKHHTPVQILIGWMVSMICVFVVFRLML